LDAAFAHDGPSVIEVMIDARATPIHSFRRRLAEPAKAKVRPGTVYELRDWTCSPDLEAEETVPAE
jgi:acetolactate synthase-1/2/3 large subunit